MGRIIDRVKEMRETAQLLDYFDDPPMGNETLARLYVAYPYLPHALVFIAISILATIALLRMCIRNRKGTTTQPPPPTNLTSTPHEQKPLSRYPPGMQVDMVEAKLRAQRREPSPAWAAPKLKMVEEPRVRRKLEVFPEGKLYRGSVKIDSDFGKPERA